MKLNYACRVERGIRPSNDDRAMAAGRLVEEGTISGEESTPMAAVVCDGCGGYNGGGLAAQTVLQILGNTDPAVLADPAMLQDALAAAGRAVSRKKQEFPDYSEMCTTVAGCVFTDTNTIIFHAGDSRVYRFDGISLAKLTADHSAIQVLVDAGTITGEQARVSPSRNIITRCIGAGNPEADITILDNPITPGDLFLLCSDGLWESMEHRQLKQLLAKDASLSQKADMLVKAALEHGADDNITVCLCACPGDSIKKESKPFILD